MARDWHETFRSWAKPPSDTEESKASNAARMINDAVRESGVLNGRTFKVYPTGSYRNNTNIRLGSDVDVAIVLQDAIFYSIPAGTSPADFGLGLAAPYKLADFRRDIGTALRAKFGSDVTLGNKTFDIAGNSYRLPADATPFLLHRHYTGKRRADGTWEYFEGVETRPVNDPAKRIINWHDAHYANGVRKNDATNRRYKRLTRILKRLRDDMRAQGNASAIAAAKPIASFLVECLVYNAGDQCFNKSNGTYYDDVRAVISDTWSRTKDDTLAAGHLEVSERKALFGAHQAWERAHAHEFLLRAWHHAELK